MSKSKKGKPGPNWPKLLTAVGGVIGAVAALVTALNGTGLLGPTTSVPAETATRTTPLTVGVTESPAAPAVLLEEDFSDPNSGWDAGKDADAEWAYRDGEYRIMVHGTDLAVWSNTRERHDWANLVMIVEARRVEGPLDNQYGVIARYRDRGNFYVFAISSDGMYAVQMLRDDEWVDLVTWTASDVVRQGEATNLLRVECRGTRMRFFVNDEMLAEVEDDTFSSGDVGLLAGTFAEGGVEVHFDNLLVRALAES